MVPRISVIVTSYNQSAALAFLLASLERQTFKDFEVLIADDGSSDATEALCREPRPFEVIFVTQPDQGYRKSKILNQAIPRARAEYLVFLDGDVVLEPHFLEDHWALKQPRAFVCGRRVDLGPEFTAGLTVVDVQRGRFDGMSVALWRSARKGDTQGAKRAVRIPFRPLRALLGYTRPIDLLGSNFSIWKQDLVEVNGFNEAMEAYWGEDGDLFIRLRNSGKRAIGAKGLCIQFHLFHKRREPTPENVALYQRLVQDKQYVRAVKGLIHG